MSVDFSFPRAGFRIHPDQPSLDPASPSGLEWIMYIIKQAHACRLCDRRASRHGGVTYMHGYAARAVPRRSIASRLRLRSLFLRLALHVRRPLLSLSLLPLLKLVLNLLFLRRLRRRTPERAIHPLATHLPLHELRKR